MDTLNEKLKESADKLVAQGSSFWAITRGAGEGFVSRTRTASGSFWSEAVEASGELLTTTKDAQKELLDVVQEEADTWLEYFRTESTKLRLEGLPKKLSAPGAAEGMKVPSVREMEKRLLAGLGGALQELETKVQRRIQALDSLALPAPRTKKNGAAKKSGAKAAKRVAEDAIALAKAPMTGYDDLTAKEVVTKLPKLDNKKVEALLSYEQQTKNRATVVTAMRAKLSA